MFIRKTSFLVSLLLIMEVFFSQNNVLEGKNFKATKLRALLIIVDDYKVKYEKSQSENSEIKDFIKEIKDGAADRKKNLARVNNFLKSLKKKKIVKLKKKVLRGKKATSKNIKKYIRKAVKKTKKGEILLVYFSGHGGMRDHNANTFVYSADGDTIKRSRLKTMVNRSKARLNLLITDNGSKYIPLTRPVVSRVSMTADQKKKAYINLLYNYRGTLHISAASEGEEAHPSFFTKSLFKETLMTSPKQTWEANFLEAKDKTVSKARSISRKQTPKAYELPEYMKKANSKVVVRMVSRKAARAKISKSITALYHIDGEVWHYMKSKHKKAINFCILSDGYTWDDLILGGVCEKECKKLADYIFSISPFREYRDYFNVYIVFVQSRHKGADDNPQVNNKDTALNASYGIRGIPRLLVARDLQKASYYIKKIGKRMDATIVSVNDGRHGGAGGYLATTAKSPISPKIALHELGHSFCGLADEYIDERIKNRYPLSGVKNRPNVDTKKSRKRVKWRKLIGKKGFKGVGVFEGGYYRTKGVWRSQKSCVMGGWVKNFCAACQVALVKKISKLTGRKYRLADYLKRKKRNNKIARKKKKSKGKKNKVKKPNISIGAINIFPCQQNMCFDVSKIKIKRMKGKKISFLVGLSQNGKWIAGTFTKTKSQKLLYSPSFFNGPVRFFCKFADLEKGNVRTQYWASFFLIDDSSNKVLKRFDKPFYYKFE